MNKEQLEELIVWLSCHMLEDSKEFLENFKNLNLLGKITEKLQKKEITNSQLFYSMLRLIHIYLKNIYLSLLNYLEYEFIEKLVDIAEKYSCYLNDKEIKINLIYICVYLLHQDDNKIKLKFLKHDKLFFNFMNFDFTFQLSYEAYVIRMLGYILRSEDRIVDV